MQQIRIVALLGGRHAETLKPAKGVFERVEAGAPAFIRKRRIGDDVIKLLEGATILVFWIGERVALLDQCLRVVVEDHVHAGEAARGAVLLLTVERQLRVGLVDYLQKQ